MSCPSDIKQHVEQALGDDPRMALVGVRRLAKEDLPWLEERAVRFARAQGYSWGKIGRLLQRARQSVYTRFKPIDGTPQPLPKRPVDRSRRVMALWYESLDDARRKREFDELDPNDVVPW